VKEILRARPHLALLDVQMPELDGFEVVQRLPDHEWPAVVFITAFDRYALRAFEVHAIDYLLKPFSAERFRTALGRARERLRRRTHDAGLAALVDELRQRPRYLTRIAIRLRGRVIPLPVSSIDWIQAADNYVTLHAGGREHLVRETLAALERQLDPDRFTRIHRSTLVNVDRVAEIGAAGHGDAEIRLRDGTTLTVSRTWRERLLTVVQA
jgi:two-component system LytT family response regulator